MKQWIGAVFLVLLVCAAGLSLSSCRQEGEPLPSQEESPLSTARESEGGAENKPYEHLPYRDLSSVEWRMLFVEDPTTGIRLQMNFPVDWELKKSQRGWDLLRDGRTIGVLTTQALSAPEESYERIPYLGTKLYGWSQIYRRAQEGEDRFSRYFEYQGKYEEKTFTLRMEVDYGELGRKEAQRVLFIVQTIPPAANVAVPLPPSQTNGSKEILILGNSFISTSRVGDFLKNLLQQGGKDFSVRGWSIGGAHMETFANHQSVMQQIGSGQYAYVFLCGFYYSDSPEKMEPIRAACSQSGTSLVMFPAHNEKESFVLEAAKQYPQVPLLDWKGEIDDLIQSGVKESELRIADTHGHSTPLAGYVGAHLIYRLLFGEMPPSLGSGAPLNQKSVDQILGAYATKGLEREEDSFPVYIINE